MLEEVGLVKTFNLQYEPAGQDATLLAAYDNVFIHTKQTECLVDSCQTSLGFDCETPLTSPYLVIGTTPYPVTASVSSLNGYS